MPSEEDLDEMSRWLRDHKRVSYTAWLVLEYALGWIIAAQEAIEARQIPALHRDRPARQGTAVRA